MKHTHNTLSMFELVPVFSLSFIIIGPTLTGGEVISNAMTLALFRIGLNGKPEYEGKKDKRDRAWCASSFLKTIDPMRRQQQSHSPTTPNFLEDMR